MANNIWKNFVERPLQADVRDGCSTK